MTEAVFPRAPGTYVLWLHVATPRSLAVGRLGTFDFPAGFYGYVGSARGPGGLAGRLKHHLACAVRPHWHIDYLRAAAPACAVWWCADDEAHEHDWAAALAGLPGAFVPALRFGASDCRCDSHLYGFAALPALASFQAAGGEVKRYGAADFSEADAASLRIFSASAFSAGRCFSTNSVVWYW